MLSAPYSTHTSFSLKTLIHSVSFNIFFLFFFQSTLPLSSLSITHYNQTTSSKEREEEKEKRKMAFIPTTIRPLSPTALRGAKSMCLSPTPVAVVSAVRSSRVVKRVVAPRMDTSWEGKSPPSDVLGIGKDVPSSLYLLGSVIALLLGSYSVYMSNFFNRLSAESVNPQFVVGSLLVPISWGLCVVKKFCFLFFYSFTLC